jgi:hypothetical protein
VCLGGVSDLENENVLEFACNFQLLNASEHTNVSIELLPEKNELLETKKKKKKQKNALKTEILELTPLT